MAVGRFCSPRRWRWPDWRRSTRWRAASPGPSGPAIPVRLLLAKNPAGWTAIFDLLDESGPNHLPVVLSVNARVADGLDTSWLWDVPFERLAGRPVVATGDRRLDLAVRLRYAEVPCTVVPDPLDALDRAVGCVPAPAGPAVPGIDFVGNYTAFAELRSRL